MFNTLKFIIKSVVIFLWIVVAVISLNHKQFDFNFFVFPTFYLGTLFWTTLFLTIAYLGINFFKQCLFVFIIFFLIGYFIGPYLEPPADPLEHTRFAYSYCDKDSKEVRKIGFELWHYSMLSTFLCSDNGYTNPRVILNRFDILNGMIWGMLMTGLFILTKSVGVPGRWAFIGSITAFLFLGTNRFSYFSYYTMSSSSSSILICWLWTAAFFQKNNWEHIITGLLFSLICVIVLLTNHIQEAVFLGFITIAWLFVNFNEKVWRSISIKKNSSRFSHQHIRSFKFNILGRYSHLNYLLCLCIILFLLPQSNYFQQILSTFFIGNNWEANQEVVLFVNGFHLFGKIWSYRVADTMGTAGFVPVLLIIPFFLPNFVRVDNFKKLRIIFLGLLPLAVYMTPLLNYIWLSNIKAGVYYRLSYCSMFWVPTAFFLYSIENRLVINLKKVLKVVKTKSSIPDFRNLRRIYCTVCLCLIIFISTIRSGPIYGKLDHIILDSRPWWNEWKAMIQNILKGDNSLLFTDPQTSAVMKGVFNYPIAYKFREFERKDIIDVENIAKNYPDFKCLVNLQGYSPSWLPLETGHWLPDLANTSLYYRYNNITGEELIKYLKKNPPKDYEVYY